MLARKKPWIKILAENFLLNLSLLVIIISRFASNLINNSLGIENIIFFSISIAGLVLLVISKKEQLKRKEFLKFGSKDMSARDKKMYKISYALMLIGLFFAFIY